MRTIELAPAVWWGYFDALARQRVGAPTTVQVVSGGGAAAPDTTARALRAISFDRDQAVIELRVGGADAKRPAVRYFVFGPRRVVAIEAAGSQTIVVLDQARALTLVRLLERPLGPSEGFPVRLARPDPPLGERARRPGCADGRSGPRRARARRRGR